MNDRENTQKEHIEDELRLSESRYHQIFSDNPLPSLVYDSETLQIIDINNIAMEHYQYSREEFLALTIKELCPPEDMPSLMEHFAKTDPSQERKPWRHKKKDGSIINVEVTERTLEFTGKKYRIAFIKDITEQKLAEKEKEKLQTLLFQAKMMEVVGQLAGSVVHDFNNILTSLVGYGSLLEMEISEDSPLRQYVEQMLSSAEKAADLTQSLLAFSRKQTISLKPCSLNDIITSVEKLLKRLLMEDIELKINLTDKTLIIMADIAQIDQVIINISTNARDAMPNGGTLTIETKLLNPDIKHNDAQVNEVPGEYAFLSISDTGTGMNDTIKEKIFDPFFTTKEIGQGAGLGLSIVYGIIKQHNGFITVQSKENHGTTFNIYLPLVAAASEKHRAASFHSRKGAETILLAEDNQDVRRLTKEVLERTGYTVIETVDGEDAIRQFLKNKETIDFLIIDAVMPGKNGKEVYEEIKKIKPNMKALFTSGYTKDIIINKGIYDPSYNFLSKPLSPNELLQRVRELLDQ
jgi:two-component system, cell cycle sensor histidine kinase and response regulator CckA